MIRQVFSDLFKERELRPEPRRIVLYTDEAGMQMFSLMVEFEQYIPDGIRWWLYVPKLLKGDKRFIEISLFEKAGLYKIRIFPTWTEGPRYWFYYGTKLLFKGYQLGDWKELGYTGLQTPYHILRKNEINKN